MLFRFAPDRRPIELLPPPVLRERRHSCVARRLVAVCRRAILMMSKGERPHPRRAYRRGVDLEDAADDGGRWQWGASAESASAHARVSRRRPQARRTRALVWQWCHSLRKSVCFSMCAGSAYWCHLSAKSFAISTNGSVRSESSRQPGCRAFYSRRQLFPNAAIAASRASPRARASERTSRR